MGENITLIIGVSSFVASLITWYGAAVKKRYAAERAVHHAQRNYENLSGNVALLSDLLDDKLDRILLVVTKIELRQDVILSQTGRPKDDK